MIFTMIFPLSELCFRGVILKIEFNADEFFDKMSQNTEKLNESLQTVADFAAADFKNYAKANAPWVDRSGMLRRSIDSATSFEKGILEIALYDQEDYGVYLELGFEKKYAILLPTVELLATDVLSTILN